MKIKTSPYLLILFCILSGCSKEKICADLPTGWYEVSTVELGKTDKGDIFIEVVNDNHIVLLSKDTLSKEGCKVQGRIHSFGYDLDGETSRKIGGYVIEGTYTRVVTPNTGRGNPNRPRYTVTGTFKMKSTD